SAAVAAAADAGAALLGLGGLAEEAAHGAGVEEAHGEGVVADDLVEDGLAVLRHPGLVAEVVLHQAPYVGLVVTGLVVDGLGIEERVRQLLGVAQRLPEPLLGVGGAVAGRQPEGGRHQQPAQPDAPPRRPHGWISSALRSSVRGSS